MRTFIIRLILRISPRAVSSSAAVVSFMAGIGILTALGLGPWSAGGPPMDRLGAALALLLGGLALSVLRDEHPGVARKRIAAAGAGGVALIGFVILLAHAAQSGAAVPQRPSFHTGAILALIGLALVALDVRVPRAPHPAQFLTLLAFIVAVVALLGHAGGAPLLYAMSDAGISWPMAVAGAVLSLGVLCARPDAGFVALLRSPGGSGLVARTLALTPLLIPMGMGLLVLIGQWAGVLSLTASAWIFQMAYFGGFTFIIWWVASVIRRTELEKAQHQAHFRSVAETAAQAIISGDRTGRITYLNPAGERMFGYSATEIAGQPLAALLSGYSLADHQRELTRVLAPPEGRTAGRATEAIGVRRDGAEFPIEFSVAVWQTGSDTCFSAILSDIGDRKRAEAEVRRLNAELEERVRVRTAELDRANAALREEEALFRGAFDTTNVAMVLTDLDNRFVRSNAAFARLFGYTPEEVRGLGLADVTHPDHLSESLDRREGLLTGAGDHFHMEKRYRHRNGHVIWGLTNVALIRAPDGRPLRYVGQVQDVTERKEAAEAVRTRTAELEAANRDLAQKNAENEMFVYSVSHDLRSPLVNLQGFSKELEKCGELLAALLAEEAVPADIRDRAQSFLGGKMAKSLGFIRSAVLRLSGIIDALLRLSRAGRVEYRREAVDVARLVARVVSAAQGTVTERGAVVRVGELPPAWGDRTAIEQVFGNLIGNALTYLDPTRPGEIEVGCRTSENGLQTYFVQDNGLGIAEGHRQKIFQAFQRAHPGIGSGEGLGLAIVSRIAERHRGRVWVESRPGEGSTFYVALPAAPETGGR